MPRDREKYLFDMLDSCRFLRPSNRQGWTVPRGPTPGGPARGVVGGDAGLTVAREVLYSFPIIRRPISSRTGIRQKERNKNV